MSDIVGDNDPLFQVICNSCKHYLFNVEGPDCLAFDDIPKDILLGKIKHDKPLKGQKGDFVFEPED